MANSFGGQGVGTNYRGNNAQQPPNMTFNSRNPGQYDTKNVSLGDFWMNTATEELWVLMSLQGNSTSHGMLADWALVTGATGTVNTITSNSGGAVDPDGSGNINIVGDGSTIVGTGFPGTHSIRLSTTGAVATTYAADTGTAIPSGGVLNIDGGSNINTSASGNTVSINLNDSVTITGSFASASVTTTSGNIISAANISTAGGDIITGTGDITAATGTISAGSNIISTLGNISATSGTITAGTGLSVLSFGAGVVQSDAGGTLSSSNGTNGQILIGGGTAPVWATLTAGSGISIANAANSITISATASTTTPLFQAVFGSGVSNVTGDGTLYTLLWDTAVFDQTSSYNPATGFFTAPVNGFYVFSAFFLVTGLTASFTGLNAYIYTTSRNYLTTLLNPANSFSGNQYLVHVPATICQMSAGDTASIRFSVGASTKTIGIVAPGSSAFSGYLIY